MVIFEVVPIISIPGGDEDIGIEDWGACAAVTGCETLKVKNQHDSKKLIKIKKSCYNKGFYQGVMQVGSQKGKLVQDAKPVVRKEMLDEGTAAVYWELEDLVVSLQNIVAFIDQQVYQIRGRGLGFCVYGMCKTQTIQRVHWGKSCYVKYLTGLETVCNVTLAGTVTSSRDEQFVIESLSDSTIYMAYYTIGTLLQRR